MAETIRFTNVQGRIEQKPRFNACAFFAFFFLILILLAVGFGFLQYNNYKSFSESRVLNSQTKTFVVNEGESLESITSRLVEEGFLTKTEVLSIPAYKIYLQLNSINTTSIQPGEHEIPAGVSVSEVFTYLKPKECSTVNVTLKEGLRIEEFAEALETQFTGKPDVKFTRTDFISKAKRFSPSAKFSSSYTVPTNLEGFLFPDTYQFCSDADAQQIIEKMLVTFDTKVYKPNASLIASNEYSLKDLINIASMVQRESRNDDESKVIASIILNRLEIDEVLGIDATTQYSAGYSSTQKTWWRRGAELDAIIETDNAYNTRTRAGLPPTPISNPGKSTVEAVLNPEETDYLYYIHDADGQIYYAKTLSQHNQNVCRYLGC